jgi:hypothetical protein
MKTVTRILMVFLVLGFMSFTWMKSSQSLTVKPGIYASCFFNTCTDAKQTEIGAKLTLNKDNTFTYFDNFNRYRIVDVQGTWSQENGVVTLKGYTSKYPISDKWKLDESNNRNLKSRKGLEWRTIHRVVGCN